MPELIIDIVSGSVFSCGAAFSYFEFEEKKKKHQKYQWELARTIFMTFMLIWIVAN